MLIIVQPIDFADDIAKLIFYILWYESEGFMFIAYGDIGGTLPTTAVFISLLNKLNDLP